MKLEDVGFVLQGWFEKTGYIEITAPAWSDKKWRCWLGENTHPGFGKTMLEAIENAQAKMIKEEENE